MSEAESITQFIIFLQIFIPRNIWMCWIPHHDTSDCTISGHMGIWMWQNYSNFESWQPLIGFCFTQTVIRWLMSCLACWKILISWQVFHSSSSIYHNLFSKCPPFHLRLKLLHIFTRWWMNRKVFCKREILILLKFKLKEKFAKPNITFIFLSTL